MEEEERDGFFKHYGISLEEEQFFKILYRRRQIYRRIIAILILALTVLLILKL